MRIGKKPSRPKKASRQITVTGVWLKVLEAPGPLLMPLAPDVIMRYGESLTIELNFDELLDVMGTGIGGDDG